MELIAAEYQQMEAGDDDGQQIDNIDGDWLTMCRLAPKPVAKEDIFFQTMEDSKLAENHIIVCGMVENIKHFVMPLRAKYLKE